jgi:bifunctional DNA-binding transcriptional regulator/antitoxin component of YhaV-PrlF toxin-antitoxin module
MLSIIEKGSKITIPAGCAEELYLREGCEVEIFTRGSELVIKRAILSCIFCDAAGKLVRIGRMCACRDCIERLYEAKDGDYLFPKLR